MTKSRIIVTQGFDACIEALCALTNGHKVFVLIDPAVSDTLNLPDGFRFYITPRGEEAKTLATADRIWTLLQEEAYSRSDFVVTIGGGAISDLGGFVASTYKRGMHLVHIPTTILGAVDAAIGGKTAVDYGGVKNLIGTFYPPDAVIVTDHFFGTLPQSEILSGWGEVLKYALLSTSCTLSKSDSERLQRRSAPSAECIAKCMEYKVEITTEDLEDKGIRQFLNLGHTVGHALEALMMEHKTPVPHGIAVVAGMAVELYLSLMKSGFPQKELMAFVRTAKAAFPPINYSCTEYEEIERLARQDKKNKDDNIRCVLLREVGQPILPEVIKMDELYEALDFYKDFMGV